MCALSPRTSSSWTGDDGRVTAVTTCGSKPAGGVAVESSGRADSERAGNGLRLDADGDRMTHRGAERVAREHLDGGRARVARTQQHGARHAHRGDDRAVGA